MKPYFKPILLTASLLLFLLFIVAKSPARAGAAHFPTFEEVQQMIANALSPVQSSIQALSNRVSNLETTVTPIPAQVADLQKRVSALETQIPQPTPTPKTFTFFNGSINPNGQTSPVFDTQGGYSKILVSFQCTVGSVPVDIQASTNQKTLTTPKNSLPSFYHTPLQ